MFEQCCKPVIVPHPPRFFLALHLVQSLYDLLVTNASPGGLERIPHTSGFALMDVPAVGLFVPPVPIGRFVEGVACRISPFIRPAHVLPDADAFFFCDDRQYIQQQFRLVVHGVDSLFFKENRYAQLLEVVDGGQAVAQVARKTRDGLGHHDIDLPVLTVAEHPLEFRAALDRCA